MKLISTLLILLTSCTISRLTTDELVNWQVEKDTIFYQNKPIAKIVVYSKESLIPINSTCDRSKDYKNKEHYELIHGINTLETLIVRINKEVEMTKLLKKFTDAKYKELNYYR